MKSPVPDILRAAVITLAVSSASLAQEPPLLPPPEPPAPTLVIERMEEGWLVAPDARVGHLEGGVARLARVDGGPTSDRTGLGGDAATIPVTVAELVGRHAHYFTTRHVRFGSRALSDSAARVAVSDEFFVAESQINLLLSVSRRYRFSVACRVVGAAPALDDDPEGTSGSVALQVGR